jgi:tRNA 2-thiocytidine biosynthesis protein TtcA
VQIGNMLREWEKQYPGRTETMFTALQNVAPSHLMDAKLFDFKGVSASGVEDAEGDIAFDAEAFSAPALPGLQVVAG